MPVPIQLKAFRRFGVVLPLVLLVCIAIISAFGLGEAFIFNPLGLILILHTIFLTVIGIIVAIVSAKSYLRQGNLSILLLGTAVLIFAVVALVGGILTFGLAALLDQVLLSNYGTIINNISTFVSSAVQVISAVVAFLVVNSSEAAKRKKILAAACLGVVVFIITLTAVTFLGIMPVFLTSQGPTPIRTIVLGATAFLFFLAVCSSFGVINSQRLRLYTGILWLWVCSPLLSSVLCFNSSLPTASAGLVELRSILEVSSS
jgi:hypothetical protein